MSYESENEDVTTGVAAELTRSLGVPEDATSDDVLPNDLADAVEEQERHLAERDIPVNNDVDDTREAAEQREAEQAQKPGRGQKVPLAALHEERQKRQALETEAQQLRQQLQQFVAQQQAAQQSQLQAQQEAAIPDFDEDPRGHIEAVKQQFKQELEQLKNGPAQQPQAESVQAQFQRGVAEVTPVLVESETRAMEQFPDYSEAATFAQQAVLQNIRAAHPGATPEQLQNIQTAALIQFTRQCQAQGIDPASHIYQRAQAMGYQPASRAPRKQPNTSLSDAAGSARAPDEGGSIRASDISSMSEEEFDKLWSNMKRSSAVGPAF